MFKTDGSSHKNGVKAEDNFVTMINENDKVRDAYLRVSEIDKSKFIKAEKRGGTRLLQDIVLLCRDKEILNSHKQQAGTTGGTFDWANSSSLVAELSKNSEALSEICKYFKDKRGSYKGKSKDQQVKNRMRAELKEKCSDCLDGLESRSLRLLLAEVFKKYDAGENILISVGNSETHTLQVFPSSRLPIFDYLQNVDRYNFFLATPKRGAKTSRQVYVRDSQTGEEINTDLRVRLTTNNGIGAWLGGKDWSSNTSASLSFKVQQDNVGALLDNVAEYSEIVNYGD